MSDKQTGQELELAYTASDRLTVNTVMFSSKNDEGANKGDKYKSTGGEIHHRPRPVGIAWVHHLHHANAGTKQG